MKKLTSIILLFISITLSGTNNSKPNVITLFKRVVDKVDVSFKKQPTVIVNQDYSDSKSGKIFYKYQFEFIEIKYDVQKTTSLISPYTAYILLKIKVNTNAKRGDVAGYFEGNNIGFSDFDSAKQNNNFESCVNQRGDDINMWCIGDIKINYAFQEGKWVFKSIETETSKRIGNGSIIHDIENNAIDSLFSK
jgi:hypothetical protein